MDPVRKKACPVSLCMPDLEHLEGITMLLRPPRPAPAGLTRVCPPSPAPAGAGGADGGEKIFAGQAGAHCIFARVVIK